MDNVSGNNPPAENIPVENIPAKKAPAAKAKLAALIAAAVIFVGAMIWYISLAPGSPSSSICDQLNRCGYSFGSDDLFPLGSYTRVSIREIINGEDLTEPIAASLSAGFGADVDRHGDVTVVLIDLGDDEHVLSAFVVDGTVELAFIQSVDTGAILPLGAGA